MASMGKLIAIEGIDGSGTTTQAQRISAWMRKEKKSVVSTAEPSSGPIGLLIRQILSERVVGKPIDGRPSPIAQEAIALLFAADRVDHLDGEINPWLEKGFYVITDRYYHSSLVYQTLAGCGFNWMKDINKYARKPDVTFLLDVDSNIASMRRRERGCREMYEEDNFQSRLAQAYRRLPSLLLDEDIVVIDANRETSQVSKDIASGIIQRFQR